MNRKHLSVLVGWFFAISLLLMGTSTPVCAADLTYSTFFPATHANAILAQQWCDEIAKRNQWSGQDQFVSRRYSYPCGPML